MGVGNKDAALALERAIAVIPVEKDAFDGPAPIEILARVAAHMGERDRAIVAVQKILPYRTRVRWAAGSAPYSCLCRSLSSASIPAGDIGLRATVADFQSATYLGYADNSDGYPRISRFMSLTVRNGPTTLSRMNKLCILPTFVISLLLLALTPGLRAQTAQGIENAEKVAQELKLTPQQEAKVLPILKQEAPKIEAIKNNPSLSGIQKMRQLRAIHSETAPELQKILSPEQYQKLQAIREERIKEAMAKKSAGG